jgi:hypothetical protein
MRGIRWALLLVLLAGCGNVGGTSLNPLPPSTRQPTDGGFIIPTNRDAPLDQRRDAGAVVPGIDGGGVPAEVQIIILAPVGGTVLKAVSSPEVRAQVTASMPIDAGPLGDQINTVTYSLTPADAKDAKPLVTGPLFGPAANSEFATRTDLTTLPTGDYLLAVTAVTQNGGTAVSSIAVQVDAGPTIRIVSPKSGGAYKGSVAVQVQIDSSPFLPTFEPIEATVGGYPITLAASGTAGFYEGLIELESYTPPLVDEQKLTVAAINSQGTRNEASVKFIVDVYGPTFSDTLPAPGSVVGGVILVRAKLTDVSGILSPSVIAIIGDKANNVSFTLELNPEPGADGYYSALFDTAKLTPCKPAPDVSLCIVMPNLSFRASDTLGNDSYMAYDFAIDNHPPVFDLDPPPIRLVTFDTTRRIDVCSWAFDPLGDYTRVGDMPDDNCVVAQAFDLRARIEDWGNRAEGLKVVPISGVDPATTSMYVLRDPTQPLVVDMDGDGVCDGINPLLVPTTTPPQTSNQVLTVRLLPVPPTGSGDFTKDPALRDPDEPSPGDPVVMVNYPYCNAGAEKEAPTRLCGAQSSSIALGYPTALDPQSSIWTIEPLTDGEPWCMGGQFDTYANQIGPGWACFAAAGADMNGNKGVSAPLHLWIDYRYLEDGFPAFGPCANPPAAAGAAPDCTGTYDPTTNQVSAAKKCTARHFGYYESRWQNAVTAAGAAAN